MRFFDGIDLNMALGLSEFEIFLPSSVGLNSMPNFKARNSGPLPYGIRLVCIRVVSSAGLRGCGEWFVTFEQVRIWTNLGSGNLTLKFNLNNHSTSKIMSKRGNIRFNFKFDSSNILAALSSEKNITSFPFLS
jgi:hypothetical protein